MGPFIFDLFKKAILGLSLVSVNAAQVWSSYPPKCRTSARRSSQSFLSGRSWDTWMTYSPKDKLYHSYSQWVPEAAYTPGRFDFHNQAQIFHRSSPDAARWTDHGLIDIRGESVLNLPDHAYWSGSIRYHQGKFFLFYTRGGNESSPVQGDQRILMATSLDGHTFSQAQEVFSPESISGETFPSGTYTFEATAQGDKVHIPSLRDPHIVQGSEGMEKIPEASPWYMLFSTNLRKRDGPAMHGIGVARSDDLRNWSLDDPLDLPITADQQIELPNLLRVDERRFGYKLLLLASARGHQGSEILLWGSQGLRSPWIKIEITTPPPANSYGYNLVEMADGSLKLVYFDETQVRLSEKLASVHIGKFSVSIDWSSPKREPLSFRHSL